METLDVTEMASYLYTHFYKGLADDVAVGPCAELERACAMFPMIWRVNSTTYQNVALSLCSLDQ